MKLLQAMKRELLLAVRDPRRLVFLFGAAVAYLIVFGLLYVPNLVKDVPCVVYDAENSHFSRELVRDIESSDSMKAAVFVTSEEEMQNALNTKQAYAAIEIPPDFSKKVKTGQGADVLYMANGANIILTNITSSAMQDILAAFSDRAAAERTALRTGGDEQLLQHMIAPVHVHLRVLYNTTQGYMFFFLLGLAMVAFQQGIFFAVGAAVDGEYEQAQAGAHDWQNSSLLLLAAKFVLYWCLAMLSYLLVVFLVQEVFEIPLKAPLGTLLTLAAIFITAAIAFAVFFSSLFNREMEFVRAIIMYPVPAFIFSGYTWPQESMPVWLQQIAGLFPLSWFSNTVRELFLAGHSPRLAADCQALTILAVVFMGLGAVIFCLKMRHYCRLGAKN
ncbi:ABC transporter permease [Mitsuokella sp. WILCCON 0060]|uniref:ABC transporter permease n=1 Tax=Mitsuokella sp. WILCCON 0060 TaxID=3345341 RepID=UPI003F1E3F61